MKLLVAMAVLLAAAVLGMDAQAQALGARIDIATTSLKNEPQTIFGFLSPPPSPKTRNPAVVLLHGSGGFPGGLADYVKLLTERGYYVLALDSCITRGTSDYTHPPSTKAKAFKDIPEFLERAMPAGNQ